VKLFSLALWKGVTGSHTVSVMAGLDPAIHVFACRRKKHVDARHKAEHDELEPLRRV
jgi:hypothetical protein